MKNLTNAFEELKKEIHFIYNLKFHQQKNTRLFDTLRDLGEYYDFLDKANFDANLKGFIFRNSVLLSQPNYSIYCYLDTEDKKVFFHIFKKRENA